MKRISDALNEIVSGNSFLQFGLYNKMLNLSKLAYFIKPLVELRTKKELKQSAILMNLSRMQTRIAKIAPRVDDFEITHMTIRSDLALMTFDRSQDVHKRLNSLYVEIQKQDGYITMNHGIHELTLIIDSEFLPTLEIFITEKPKYINKYISALSVQFDQKFFEIPGLLYSLMQQITLQNLNIIEISSTFTEFSFYLDQKDIPLAFDTIYERFLRKKKDI